MIDGNIHKGFNISHLNIRSLKPKLSEIELTLNLYNLQVLTLSETWLTSHIEDTVLVIQNYNLSRLDRSHSSLRGGGLAIYSRKDLPINADEYKHLNHNSSDLEDQIVSIKKDNNKKVLITNAYRPPVGNKSLFLEQLMLILATISTEAQADIFLLGDLNIDHSDNNNSEFIRNLGNSLNTLGLTQTIKKPTRQTLNTSTLLDVIYVKTAKEFSPFLLRLSLSDHYLVGLSTFLNYHKDPQTHFHGRTYRSYTLDKPRTYYNSINRSKIFQFNDVNLVWTTLRDYISRCAKKLCPLVKITTKVNQLKWITNEIVELLNDRDKAFLKALVTKNPADLKEAKSLRRQAEQAVRTARSAHNQDTLDHSSDNPRKFWRQLNALIKQKASNPTIRLTDDNNSPIEHANIPDYINNYFSTIGPKLAEQFNTTSLPSSNNITPSPPPSPPTPTNNPPTNPACPTPISENEILKEVKAIAIYKSSGIPGLSSL